MEQWSEIRRRIRVEGVRQRQVLWETGMHWKTLKKILEHSELPGYRHRQRRPRKKLGPYFSKIEHILSRNDSDISVSFA